MTATQLPNPTVRSLQVVYYPARWESDGADADALPDLVTQGAVVTLTPTAPAHRLAGVPARMVDSLRGNWTVDESGELLDTLGRLGMWIPDPAETGVDYTFTVTHTSGVQVSGTVTGGTPLPDVVNLADYAGVMGEPVDTTILQRVAALESGLGGGPGGPATWESVTGKPSAFPPAQHTHDASEITNLPEPVVVATWDSLEGKPTEFTPAAHQHTVDSLADAGEVGAQLLATTTPEEARAAIGAGTSNLTVGSGPNDAAPGNHLHDGRYVRTVNGASADASGNVAVPIIVVDPVSTAGLPEGTLIARTV